MNETEFINSDIQPNAYYMHEQLKENNYSFSSFLLLAAVCVEQYIAFSDIFLFSFLWTKGKQGTLGSLHIPWVILERPSFPMSVDAWFFWYSKQGFHFALNCIWGSCAFQVNSMTMHPWRTWNLSKGTQTNVILLCTEEYLVSVSHLLCQLFTRNVANVFCV